MVQLHKNTYRALIWDSFFQEATSTKKPKKKYIFDYTEKYRCAISGPILQRIFIVLVLSKTFIMLQVTFFLRVATNIFVVRFYESFRDIFDQILKFNNFAIIFLHFNCSKSFFASDSQETTFRPNFVFPSDVCSFIFL